jgi:hypothetical protein
VKKILFQKYSVPFDMFISALSHEQCKKVSLSIDFIKRFDEPHPVDVVS